QATRPDDDQVGLLVACGADQLVDWVALGDLAVRFDAQPVGLLHRLIERLPRSPELLAELALIVGLAEQDDLVANADERDRRADKSGELEAFLDCGMAAGRTVCADH